MLGKVLAHVITFYFVKIEGVGIKDVPICGPELV